MDNSQMLEGVFDKREPYQDWPESKLPDWAENILDVIDVGVFVVDRMLKLVNSSSFVDRLLKKGRDHMIGKYLFDVIPFIEISEWEGTYTEVLMNGGTFKKGVLLYNCPENNGNSTDTFLDLTLYPIRGRMDEIVGVASLIKDVTAEIRLREERAIWKETIEDFIEDTQIGILVMDKDQKIIRYNKKAEENNLVVKERVLNRSIYEAFPRNVTTPPLSAARKNMLENHIPYDVSFDLYIPQVNDGKSTFRIREAPLSDSEDRGYVMFVDREDTFYETKREMKEKTKDLNLSTKFFYQAIDASPSIVISSDNHDRIMSFNKTAEDIYGYKATNMIGSRYYSLFSKEGKEKIEAIVLSDLSHWQGEMDGIRKDGSCFPTKISISKVVDEDGNRIALILIVEDITEKKKLKQSLTQSMKMAALGEMIGGLAHQLNNPLVGVVNVTDVLRKRVGTDDPNFDLIKTVGDAAGECRNITNSLLKFSRKPAPLFSELDLVQTLENSLLLANSKFLISRINLIKEYHPHIPKILGDDTQLQQAFINIIINAVQALQNGGDLRVEVKNGNGRMAGNGNSFVEVIFTDTGIGISRKNLDKIFDPFFTTKNLNKGTGLGLSIAYTIIKGHNGKINVDSTEGKGTTFIVRLPVS